MRNYNDSYIAVKGSDNNIYLVEVEHVDFHTIEYSLVIGKTRVDKFYSNSINNDIPNKLVESFIRTCRDRFGLSKEELLDILYTLTSATVNNHFEYLKLLKELTPKFEKLLQ